VGTQDAANRSTDCFLVSILCDPDPKSCWGVDGTIDLSSLYAGYPQQIVL
jgi:hypothetical protein